VQLGTQIPTFQRNVLPPSAEYHCEVLYDTTRRHISEDDNLCGPAFRCTRKRVSVGEKLSGVFVMCGHRTVNVYSHLTFILCLWKKTFNLIVSTVRVSETQLGVAVALGNRVQRATKWEEK
jgi:hypothetical protein